MVMSTTNRFARAVDRARDLSRQIEAAKEIHDTSLLSRISNELLVTEERAILLLKSTRAFNFHWGDSPLQLLFPLWEQVLSMQR